jgi:maleylpyruvate isomerase
MPDDAWRATSRDVGGVLRRADELPLRRWQEVEVHHVDLGLGYGYRDWPDAFVARRLPALVAQLPSRVPAGAPVPSLEHLDERDVLAWLFDRIDVPEMPPLGAWA